MADSVLSTAAAKGGTGGTGGSDGHGDLYGDLWVVVRDLDASDGNGNGEPLLDDNGQIIPIGYNEETGETFPIYLVAGDAVEGEEPDYEVPEDLLPYVQEVELERANIIRAPDRVIANALKEALGKIEGGTELTVEASGRIMVDGVLIDSPRENLALYDLIMKAGGATSWSEVQANAEAELPQPLADLIAGGWDPTGLLAGVFSKFHEISMDAVITAHTLMDVNTVTGSGDTLNIDYFGFTDGGVETFDYDRAATYGDVWVQWYQDMDGDPTDLERVQGRMLDVIWGRDVNGDGVNDPGTGEGWTDQYRKLSGDGMGFEWAGGSSSGINDWAQSVEDARKAIYVLHEYIGASEISPPVASADVLDGSSASDYLAAWAGDDTLTGRRGDDILDGGEGDDVLKGNLGNDRLDGGAGDDTLRGGNGNDVLIRGGGADRLFGGADDDRLAGGAGDDRLFGGDGDDRLNGGRGDDTLTGGDGADSFIFGPASLGDVDTITDFSSAEGDVIRLNRIDAGAATEEDDAFTFVGYVDFSGTAGELRATDLGDTQRIEGDTDGDGVADFTIDVVGATLAEADWFVL